MDFDRVHFMRPTLSAQFLKGEKKETEMGCGRNSNNVLL